MKKIKQGNQDVTFTNQYMEGTARQARKWLLATQEIVLVKIIRRKYHMHIQVVV